MCLLSGELTEVYESCNWINYPLISCLYHVFRYAVSLELFIPFLLLFLSLPLSLSLYLILSYCVSYFLLFSDSISLFTYLVTPFTAYLWTFSSLFYDESMYIVQSAKIILVHSKFELALVHAIKLFIVPILW